MKHVELPGERWRIACRIGEQAAWYRPLRQIKEIFIHLFPERSAGEGCAKDEFSLSIVLEDKVIYAGGDVLCCTYLAVHPM